MNESFSLGVGSGAIVAPFGWSLLPRQRM